MRCGIISDIHANLDALQAVLADAGELDDWLCLGDTVGYGPEPNECAAIVRERCSTVLIGNHDLAGIGLLDVSWFNPYARAAAVWTQDHLSEESISFLSSLPETSVRTDWNVTLAHGSLTDPPRDYITNRREARLNFKLLETRTLLIGHSHLSHCFSCPDSGDSCDEDVFRGTASVALREGYRYIINCGSVGQPRDGDPRAAYGVLHVEAQRVEVFRVDYDIPNVQRKIEAAGLPSLLAERLEHGM